MLVQFNVIMRMMQLRIVFFVTPEFDEKNHNRDFKDTHRALIESTRTHGAPIVSIGALKELTEL